MKKRVVLCLVLSFFTWWMNAAGIDYDRFYEKWKNISSSVLNEKGVACIVKNEMDSASAFLSIVANRYSSGMGYAEKKQCADAYNNLGYVFFYGFSDYLNSYANLLKGRQICEEIGYKGILPYLYLNIGNVFTVYDDMEKAWGMYKKAFYAAVEIRDFNILTMIYSNYLNIAIMDGRIPDMEKEMDLFCDMDIPDSVSLYNYARLCTEGARHILRKEYEESIAMFEKMQNHVDVFFTPERYRLFIYSYIAKVYFMQGKYESAAKQLSDAEAVIDTMPVGVDTRIGIYSYLGNCYEREGRFDLAEDYRFKCFKIADTVQSLKKIGELKDLESSYELHKMDDKVRELVRKRQTQTVVIRVVVLGSVIILFLLLYLYLQYRRLQKNNRELYRKNVEIFDKEEKERQQRRVYEQLISEYEAKQNAGPVDGAKPKKYISSNLNDSDKESLMSGIRNIMETCDEIYDTDFSIERLAVLVGSNVKYVSQVINEISQKNFSTFLGEYRIKEACRRLVDTENFGHLTIEAMSVGVGFKSRSNFVSVFKKVTGLTPSQYQKMARSSS